jgi:polyphosphate kinase 2 (PPK2 family)
MSAAAAMRLTQVHGEPKSTLVGLPQFLHQCPIFKLLLLDDDSLLGKYWFSVS